MRDTQFYAQILGVEEPWRVVGVQLRLEDGEVEVMMEHGKTTVYLRRADYRRLQAIAWKQERSAADLIREAVADYVAKHGRKGPLRSLGVGRSGRRDLSERADELLAGTGRRE